MRRIKVQHEDQHIDAIGKTLKSTVSVSCQIFDGKVKDMGSVQVEGGIIKISLDDVPHMVESRSYRGIFE